MHYPVICTYGRQYTYKSTYGDFTVSIATILATMRRFSAIVLILALAQLVLCNVVTPKKEGGHVVMLEENTETKESAEIAGTQDITLNSCVPIGEFVSKALVFNWYFRV